MDTESVFVFPATPAQRRFWLLDQLIPGGNPALNMSIGLRWRGPLEESILRRALNQLVARHEALRTTLEPDRKELRQLVAPTMVLELPIVGSNGSIEVNGDQIGTRLACEEAGTPFDLRAGPLFRARVVRIASDDHLLLLTIHHIVSDGWSNRVLVRDLCATYTALTRGDTTSLPELQLQFADYADWQATRLANDDFAAQRIYWRERLSGTFPGLELSFNNLQHNGLSVVSETRSRMIPPELAYAVKSLSASERASPFMIFLAVFQELLHRYTGQNDFLVTSPGANRERRELESVVGPFANPLLLRADLRGNPSFRELLGRVRDVTLQAFSNQDIPFESLLDEFQAGRLQVNFHYEVGWQPPIDLPKDVTIEMMRPVSGGTVYELSASMFEEPNGLRFEIEYKSALFSAESIERMLGHYQTLLQSAIANPLKPISSIAMMTMDEEKDLELKRKQSSADAIALISRRIGATNHEAVRPYLGLQLQLITMWEDVLGVRGIGIRDNFFDLGGNSLLAMRMLQRAEAACAKFIQPGALFRHPTIEHLAGEIAREVIDESPTIFHVNDAGTRTPFFYLHGDLSGGGFYSLKLSRSLGPDQPFYVLAPQDIRSLSTAPSIEKMAAKHLAAIRAVRPRGPYIIGGFCIGGIVAYELAQQIKASGDSVEMLLMIDSAFEDKVARSLRRLAEVIGWFLRWDDLAKVKHFGRWAVWRERFTRWRRLDIQEQVRVAWCRVWDRIGVTSNSRRATPQISEPDVSGHREYDVLSVFLWAATRYHPRPYHGPAAVLLSDDVIHGQRNIAGEWRALISEVEVQALTGSHLECITAHVDTLAQTIEDCLEPSVRRAQPSNRQSGSANSASS